MLASYRIRSYTAILLTAISFALAGPSLAQSRFDGKPIPSGADAATNAEFRDGYHRFYLTMTRAYREHTKDDAELQSVGVELFNLLARKQTLEAPASDLVAWGAEMRQLTKRMIDAGSRDPMVLQRHARLEMFAKQYDDALLWLMESERALEDAGYPRFVSLLNTYYLAALARTTQNEPLLREYFPQFVEQLLDWIVEETKTPENRRYVLLLAHAMSKDFPEVEHKERILSALSQRKYLDAWFRDTLSGAIHIDLGWRWRGNTTADLVPGPGWQKLAENLELAADHLVQAWKTEPNHPEPASHMIGVAMLGGTDESARVWFDRAVAAEMDHPQAYQNFVVLLLPRWGGSHKAMYQFGLDCLATKRFDTVVPLQLFYQVISVEQETGQTGKFWRNPKAYAKLKEMFEGYEAAAELPPEQQHWFSRARTRSLYAAAALRAEQWEDAARIIERLDGKLTDESLRAVQVRPFEIARAFALTGNVKDSAAAAEQVANEDAPSVESLTAAIEQLSDAQSKNDNPRAATYFPIKLRMLRQAGAFWSGDWVDLTFDEDLSGWQIRSGKWTRQDDRTVIGERDNPGNGQYYLPLELASLHKFPPPYVLQAEVHAAGPLAITGSGLVVGDVSFDGMREASGRMCWAHAHAVGIDSGVPLPGQNFSSGSQMIAATGLGDNHIDVRVWPQSLLMLVNRKGPYPGPAEPFDPGHRIGLAARTESSQSRVHFANVRIRRVSYAPLMNVSNHQTLLAEGTKMVEADPDDWFARWVRGTTHYHLGQHEEALADLLELERIYPEHEGMLNYSGAAFAASGQYEEAIRRFELALGKDPMNYQVIRHWAELELTAEDVNFRNPRRGLQRAREAYALATSADFTDAWQTYGTLAMAHAELGQWTEAIELAEKAVDRTPAEGKPKAEARLKEYRQQKRNSLSAAAASLFWEGDMTRRIIGFSLTAILLAANLIIISRVARYGRLAGMAAGLVGVSVSFLVPSVIAVLVGMGEGIAFVKLLVAICGGAAVCGAIGGAWMAKTRMTTE